MITDVGIDLDGVIYPFASAFKKYCMERTGVSELPDPTHWNFYEDWDMDLETFNAWLRDAATTHQVFATEDPYEGVVSAWKDLRDMGLRLHVLTARPQSAWAQTAEWLSAHNLNVDTLHFGPTKTFLKSLATDQAIMLDDHVVYYEEAEKVGIIPVLMDRPWNSHKKDATRVDSLPSFVDFIRGFNIGSKKSVTYKPSEKDKKQWDVIKPEIFPYRHPYKEKSKEPRDPYSYPRHQG